MSRKGMLALAILVIVVVAIIAGVKAFTSPGAPGGKPDHLTIAQARGQKGQVVKVGGDAVPGSINWDGAAGSLRFTLAGEGDQMPVAFTGEVPKDFKPGSPLVVEGTYSSSGTFQATSVTPRSSPLCKACHG